MSDSKPPPAATEAVLGTICHPMSPGRVSGPDDASGPIQTFATHFGGDLLRMFELKDHEPNISF